MKHFFNPSNLIFLGHLGTLNQQFSIIFPSGFAGSCQRVTREPTDEQVCFAESNLAILQ